MALPWVADGMDAFAALYVDDMEQERASATKMVSPALISGDLKHLVCTPAPILSPNSRRAFVFRGLAIGDFALARLAYQRAVGTATGAIAGFDR
jgi:ornithine cyclodeaminase/alanine dehydrogenase